MNPLPRFLGMGLFIVLAVLTAMVGAPLWQHANDAAATAAVQAGHPGVDPSLATPPASARAAHVAAFSRRIAFALALLALVLAGALLFSLALKPGGSGTSAPFSAARQELGALARLAENSAAQGGELQRERDVRRRAEEDARLKQELLAESVDEKIRLGRDLHDGIIQSLYAVGLTLETIRPLLKSDPERAEGRLDELRAMLNAAIRDVRSYITGLAPENLRRATFSHTATSLFEQLRAGRAATLEIDVDESATAVLTDDQNIEALQIAREAMSNALRHGVATRLMLRLHKGDREVGLLVQDNGRGFAGDAAPDGGHGLGNMRARAERIGASLRVSSLPGQGVRVIVTIPISETATP